MDNMGRLQYHMWWRHTIANPNLHSGNLRKRPQPIRRLQSCCLPWVQFKFIVTWFHYVLIMHVVKIFGSMWHVIFLTKYDIIFSTFWKEINFLKCDIWLLQFFKKSSKFLKISLWIVHFLISSHMWVLNLNY